MSLLVINPLHFKPIFYALSVVNIPMGIEPKWAYHYQTITIAYNYSSMSPVHFSPPIYCWYSNFPELPKWWQTLLVLRQFCEIFADDAKQSTQNTSIHQGCPRWISLSLISWSRPHVLLKATWWNFASPSATWKTSDTLQQIVCSCVSGPIYSKQINTIK